MSAIVKTKASEMQKQMYVLAMILIVMGGCVTAEPYDFRSQDRPAYAESIGVDELDELIDEEAVTLLDIRLLEDYQANPVLIPGATYYDPEQIGAWSSSIPDNSKVVVYCVRGAWVSQKAATYLNSKGYEVYTLEGGIEAWQQASQ